MQIPDILRNKTVQLISGVTTAFVVGSVGGYLLGKKNGTTYVVNTNPEQLSFGFNKPIGTIDSMEDTGNGLVVTGTFLDTPEAKQVAEMMGHVPDVNVEALDAVDKFVEHLKSDVIDPRAAPVSKRDYTKPLDDAVAVAQLEQVDEPVDTTVNVFRTRDVDDGWDQELELSNRRPDVPYVIHYEEFVADEMDFRQETLTYYEKDDIMADPADTPIYDYNGLMGTLKWGHGSGDPKVVYIRNEKIHMEWEVLLHSGSFAEEVRGLQFDLAAEEELRHAGPMKFRRGD